MYSGKKNKTQFSEHEEHLCIQLPSIFQIPSYRAASIKEEIDDDFPLQTNFSITVNNPFVFILLHLRNKGTKNPLCINIPEVCIFHDRIPYDIVFSSKGYIRGYKANEQARIKLKDVNKYFKQCWGSKNLPKSEHCMAVFAENHVLMMSENDLFLNCCKIKTDPFFKKLRYFQNKIFAAEGNPIKITYPTKSNIQTLKFATESMLDVTIEEKAKNQLSEQQYLKYLTEKIALFLNYEHNIRIRNGIFIYTKSTEGMFYFTNVQGLTFTNLTSALLRREERLKKEEQQRNRILFMTPQKQRKYKSYEGKPTTKVFEQAMNNQFNSIVRRLDFQTISDNRRQQIKNELAFKKLHPKSKYTYTQVVTSSNFMKTKAKVFNTPSRKPLTIPSRHMMRFYNKVKNPRVQTEVVTTVFKD